MPRDERLPQPLLPGADHRRHGVAELRGRGRLRRPGPSRESEVEERPIPIDEGQVVVEERSPEALPEQRADLLPGLAREASRRQDDENREPAVRRLGAHAHDDVLAAHGGEDLEEIGADLGRRAGEELRLRQRVEDGDQLLVVVASGHHLLGGEDLPQHAPEDR